jgi:asparagine synthase (glutamine-hydrolysing)
MCGLVGYFGPREVDLQSAAASIRHRGPDMQGITRAAGWTVAFNRLSIIDTSERGMQPFTFEDVSVLMNGEIYNYRELQAAHKAEFTPRTGSDVEILPFLYRKYGLAFLQKVNGMFAMVIADQRAGRYFLIRDRYGKKPLFYRSGDGGVYFASELKALKLLLPLEPDRTNLALNMACWLLVQPLTPYHGVFNVNPGCYLEFDGHGTSEHRWYQPAIQVHALSYEQVREQFMNLYRQSISFRLRSDVPVGISLSGGLDSSSMAFLARGLSPENFVAFTASVRGKEDWEGSTDTENPRQLCQDLGIRQIATTVDFDFWDKNILDIACNYDEIFLNSGTLVFYAIAAAARAHGVKVLLSGTGGDELFGGYPWQSAMRSLPVGYLSTHMRHRSSRTQRCLHRLWSNLGSGRVRTRLARTHRLLTQFQVWHAQSLCSAFVPAMRDMDEKVADRIESVSADYFRASLSAVSGDAYNQVHYANFFTVIGNQNYQFDMASMRHSVENRSPLLDVGVVEYMMSVPDRLKNRNGPKSLMRKILAEFLPRYITTARKSGPTMPLDQWFAAPDLRKRVQAFFYAERALIGDLVSADLAGRLREEALYSGPIGALRLFALLGMVIWAKINVENSIPDPSLRFTELLASAHR